MLLRTSAHDASTLAAIPSGMATAIDRHAIDGVIADEDQRRVVAPLEEGVEGALGERRERDAEGGARAGDDGAFEEHLREHARAGEPNQSERPHHLAPLVGEQHHQRQQEHRAGDDGEAGDGQVEAAEHDERVPFVFSAAAGPHADGGHARRQVPRERLGVFRTAEPDVDRRERVVCLRVVRITGQAQQVGQVEPDLEPLAGEADGIRHRFVGAGDAEPPGIRAGRVARQLDDVADLQVSRGQQLAGEEDSGEVGLRVRGCRGQPRVGEGDGEAEE